VRAHADPATLPRPQGRSVGSCYARLLASTLRGLLAMVLAVGLPCMLGAARVLLSGARVVGAAASVPQVCTWGAAVLSQPGGLSPRVGTWGAAGRAALLGAPAPRGALQGSTGEHWW